MVTSTDLSFTPTLARPTGAVAPVAAVAPAAEVRATFAFVPFAPLSTVSDLLLYLRFFCVGSLPCPTSV